MIVYKSDLLESIKGVYGDLDDERGCYYDRAWLSIANIVSIVNKYDCDKIDKGCLIEDLERIYGDINNESGCYSDRRCLSMANIGKLIDECSAFCG